MKAPKTYDQTKNERQPLVNPERTVLIPYSILVLPGPGRDWQMAKNSWNFRRCIKLVGEACICMGF